MSSFDYLCESTKELLKVERIWTSVNSRIRAAQPLTSSVFPSVQTELASPEISIHHQPLHCPSAALIRGCHSTPVHCSGALKL